MSFKKGSELLIQAHFLDVFPIEINYDYQRVFLFSFLEFSPTGTLLRLFGLFRPNYFLKYLAVPGPSLWHIAFFKLWHVGSSSLIRDRTWAPCTGSLTHSITREVPRLHFKLGAVLCHMQSSGPKIRDLNVIHTIMLYCVIPTTS